MSNELEGAQLDAFVRACICARASLSLGRAACLADSVRMKAINARQGEQHAINWSPQQRTEAPGRR